MSNKGNSIEESSENGASARAAATPGDQSETSPSLRQDTQTTAGPIFLEDTSSDHQHAAEPTPLVPVDSPRDLVTNSAGLSDGGGRRSIVALMSSDGEGLKDGEEASESEGSASSRTDESRDSDVDNVDESVPKLSENCSVPLNILDFQYSFGYDCQLHSNLCVLDPDTMAFISGDLLHFFRISDRRLSFRRSASGMGLGHITKNPQYPHFAIGEKGKRPKIIIYEWPSMKIVAVLKKGAQRGYTYLNYSLDGDLLCSMSGSPDHFFTVWNWRDALITLRAKSSGLDTFNAAFSSHMPGHITSAGSAHVRFWRMAETFTGLKLEGAQGRCGNTEVSDVIGVLAMPDGKVVSGCEWGNILVWEGGLIKCEVTKKGRKSCHIAPITQFEYFNGELMSLGMDGFVKVWYFETIDLADCPDNDRFVEVEPIFELEIVDELGPAALMCMQRKYPDNAMEHTWFAQDGGGGLWQLDLSLSADAPAPRRLYTTHASRVAGLATSPLSPYVATLGVEGRLHVYNHQGLIIARTFPAAGHALIWLPTQAASSGSVLVLACGDGVVRVVAVDLAAAEERATQHGGTALGTADTAVLLQASTAHSQAASFLAISEDGRVLASGGQDRVVFLFRVESQGQFASLAPVGFVEVEIVITFLTFKRNQAWTVLAGGVRGQLCEIQLPEVPTHNTSVSYRYKQEETTSRTLVYKSVKSRMRREKHITKTQKRRQKRMETKKKQLAKVKMENPGMEIDEDAFLADSEPEEDVVGQPEELGAVRWARYLDDDTLWLSVAGFDAGYLYTYRFGTDDPVESVAVPDNDDLEISCYLYYQDKYLLLGMGDGSVRCVRVQADPSDLTDYWSLGMHNGAVTGLSLSADLRTLFSSGVDGNVFMYSVHPDGGDPPSRLAAPTAITLPPAAEELYGADVPTLENQCAKAEHDRKMKLAAEQNQRLEQALWGLAETYNNIIKRNRQLPPSQQIPRPELELDPRIATSTRQALQAEESLMRRQLAFPLEKASLQYRKLADFYTDAVIGHGVKVYGVRKKDSYVETIRQRRLQEEFDVACALAKLRQEEAHQRGRTVEREMTHHDDDEEVVLAPAAVESFLRGVTAFEHKFNARLHRLLDKYHSRKYKRERRQLEWAQFMKKKPDMNLADPTDEELIREAEQTIGDYKLKSDDDYKVPTQQVVTTISKYQQLLDVRKQLDDLLGSFNTEVLALRQRKADLRERMAAQEAQLKRIHSELPPHLHLQPPEPPPTDIAAEYPERQYQVTEEEIEAEMEGAAASRRLPFKSAMEIQPLHADPELQILCGAHDSVLELGEHESLSKLVETQVGGGEIHRVDSDVDMTTLRSMGGVDDVNTLWEDEVRAQRLVRKVWEQRQLVDDMARQVDAVDASVEALAARRLEVQRDATLLRHQLLVLHQELVIIKACEEREEFLASKVAEKQIDCHEVQNEINSIQNKLDAKARNILRCQERVKELQLSFIEAVGDNPFADYLKKIFKKKYKPPKANDAESSDETSSSSSSEDEDDDEDEGASLESNEIGPVRFDDTSCPPGCSEDLFNLTLRVRSQRHETERDVVELHKDMEHLRKEQDAAVKRLRKVNEDLQHNVSALEEFWRGKQQRLNEVETIVVLKLSQLQHTKSSNKQADGISQGGVQQGTLPQFEQLTNTLVFNTAVLAGLDRRKQQLDDEAKAQRAKHKKNRTHLHRMEVDVRFMRGRLQTLRDQIEEAQYRKFGCIVDMTELEQALLKRFIWDLRSSADEIRTEFHGLIDNIQADVQAKFQEYKRAIEQNTERQNLLIVLLEERARLTAAVSRCQRYKGLELVEDDESPFHEDISQLQSLAKTLQARRDALLAEAVRLRQKGPLPPLFRPGSSRGPPTLPGPSAYHSVCAAEQIPPPRGPWPPACVTSIKNPMYLGGKRRRGVPTPRSGTTPLAGSRASRREATQLAVTENAEVRHPQPLQHRSVSLESVTGLTPGFLIRADMRDIPAIPSEEDLVASAPMPSVLGQEERDADDGEEDAAHLTEEPFVSSGDALGAVDGFLERLVSQDGGDDMMRVGCHDPASSASEVDVESAEHQFDTEDLDMDDDVEQGKEVPPVLDESSTDEERM